MYFYSKSHLFLNGPETQSWSGELLKSDHTSIGNDNQKVTRHVFKVRSGEPLKLKT